MGQIFSFYGATYRAAGDKRALYEAACRREGTIAHRVGKPETRRVNDGWVAVKTEYEFTDLSGRWTEEAEAAGIIEYMVL